ncbi:MAG: ribonuclease HI family protein [Campylobacterota bacterium]|nr:ribonuclease HI family protein [Campylobacterota bacterium]
MKKSKKLTINTDGSSLSNPGPAGIGIVVYNDQNDIIEKISKYIGKATNNVAEYKALIEALNFAKDFGADKVRIKSDSELIVKQINGNYMVRDKKLKILLKEALNLIEKIPTFSIIHIPREENKIADNLAKRAATLE